MRPLDLTGCVFGRLTVVELGWKKGNLRRWWCVCSCGQMSVMVSAKDLRRGQTKSCKCWQKEKAITHGKRYSRVYRTHFGMLERCYKPNNKSYPDYGGRGICVCAGWHTFESFFADMGDPPDGLSLDRIDNDASYTCGKCKECVAKGLPKNCRWATRKEQNRNTRQNRFLEYNGQVKTMAEWSEELGFNEWTIDNRLRIGWSIERALSTPV